MTKDDKNKYMCKYRKTKDGTVTSMYGSQRKSSERRGHQAPSYSKSDLKDWLYSQQLFHHLFHLWELSGYDKLLKPSVDRIDDSLPYSFSNIQLMTWSENYEKGRVGQRDGSIPTSKPHVAIEQFTKDGEYVAEYFSVHEASRITGINCGNIGETYRGKRKTAGGFIWKRKY